MSFDQARLRAQFPLLQREINGQPLTYLDSAASAQKPQSVIDAEADFYRHEYAAVHRGIHTLSARATARMEAVREQVARFIHAHHAREVVFVRGTTEGINLVASSWGASELQPGDNIIISELEHHANIVPWQMVCQRYGVELRVIPLLADGHLNIERLAQLLNNRTRLVAVAHISNVLGTVNPLEEICAMAHAAGARVLIDGAQGILHQPVDVTHLDCDFYVFSGHKLYGPTGIGILYARQAILETMPAWQGGGAMIDQVSLESGTTWADVPWRFEAGTPNTAGIIGLGAALSWVTEIGMDNIAIWEDNLMAYALTRLAAVPGLHLYGPACRKGVIAFNLGAHHAYDVGSFLDNYGVALRTGHHCAMPLMAHYRVPAMCRASLAIYNDRSDIDRLTVALLRTQSLLG